MAASAATLKRIGLPKINGRIQVKGVDGPVIVIRDNWGCVHIDARTDHDAWFGQGFCHAQDRLWQMERTRRFARGTLSEILGEALIPIDKAYRRMGLQRVSVRDFPQLNREAQNILSAFTEGVNAAVASMKKLPPEFAVLDLEFEKWSPSDSIAVWKTVYLTQTSDFNGKIFRAALARKLGAEGMKLLEAEYPEDAPVIFPPGSKGAGLGEELARLMTEVNRLAPLSAPGAGSNNWVVDGHMTETGKPLLASDPHAVIQIAPVWHMDHMKTPEWDAIGVNTPGVPGLLLFGHNEHVGWCVTNALADIADLFIEKFNESGTKYLYRDRWLDAEIRREEIRVKDRKEPVIETVPVTLHGPIVSGGPGKGVPLAWQWTGHRVVSSFECIPGMVRSANVDEFRESQRNWAGPPMNRVIADDSGNIAYQLLPDIPVRVHGGANPVPVPGWTGEYDWVGNIPFEQLPWGKSPARHFIATANNRVTGADYKYHVNLGTISYRAHRIEQMLSAKSRFTPQDFMKMQGDRFSIPAADLMAAIKKRKLAAGEPAAWKLLSAWDGILAPDSAAAALYQVFLQKLLGKLFACGKDLPGAEIVLDRWGLTYLSKLVRLMDADDRRLLELNEGTKGKTWAQVTGESLKEAWKFCKKEMGADPGKWAWRSLHKQTFVHNLGRKPPYDVLFNLPSEGVGGDGSTVFNTGGPYLKGFTPTVGVSYRMILDFSDLKHGWWMIPPGQSGHPGSPHYRDGIHVWRDVRYWPMLQDWTEIKENSEGTLRLAPEKVAEEKKS